MGEILYPRLLFKHEDFDVVFEVHAVHLGFAAFADATHRSVGFGFLVDFAFAKPAHFAAKADVFSTGNVFAKTARFYEYGFSCTAATLGTWESLDGQKLRPTCL